MFFGLPILGAPNPRADESDSKQDLQSTPSEKSERYETITGDKVPFDNVPQGTVLQAVPSTKVRLGDNKFKSIFDKISLPLKSDNLIHGKFMADSSDSISEASESVQVEDKSLGASLPSQPTLRFLPPSESQMEPVVGAPLPNIGPSSFTSTKLYGLQDKPDIIRNDLENFQIPLLPSKPKPESVPHCNCDHDKIHRLLNQMQISFGHFQNDMRGIFEEFQTVSNCNHPRHDDSYSQPTLTDVDYNKVCRDINAIRSSPAIAQVCQQLNPAIFNSQSTAANPQNLYQDDFLSYQDYVRRLQNVNSNPNTLMSSQEPNLPILESPNQIDYESENDKTVELIKQYASELPDPVVAAEVPEIVEPSPSTTVKDPILQQEEPKLSLRDRIVSLLDEYNTKNRKP